MKFLGKSIYDIEENPLTFRGLFYWFIFPLLLFLSIALVTNAEETPRRNPTAASSAGSGTAWTTPTNVYSTNNAYAVSSVSDTAQFTALLSAQNFGFTIPAGATITGLEFRVERKRSLTLNGATVNDYQVVPLGCTGTAMPHYGGLWPTTDTYKTYGYDGDMWDLDCTAEDINATSFGLGIRAGFNDTCTDYPCQARTHIDHIDAKVYYTLAPTLEQSLKIWVLPFIARARAMTCTFTAETASTTSAECDDGYVENPTQNIAWGLALFLFMFFGLIYYFKGRR